MRVLDERDEVTDAVVARPGVEKITFGQRDQRGESTCRATGDRDVVTVGESALDKISGSIDAVVHIDHTPIPIESPAISTPVPRRPAVVDIDDAKAATGPVLNLEVEA